MQIMDADEVRPELRWLPPSFQQFYNMPAGQDHYRLLEQLSREYAGDLVVDIGTFFGCSALALATNPRVTVWTYDIESFVPETAAIRDVPNITFHVKNGLNAIPDFVHKTSLIMLDVDPHDGVQEALFLDKLALYGYKGIVVCDDIHLNDEMQAWWQSITRRKEDVTHKGHATGTGIVYFD